MNSFISFELDRYGFFIDSAWFYLSISYNLMLVTAGVIIARRFYLKRRRVR